MARQRNHDLSRAIGARAREARLRAGLTQEALAERVGMQPTALSRFENGAVGLSLGAMQQVAAALCVPLAYFFTDSLAAEPRDAEEAELLHAWRMLPDEHRSAVRRMIQWARNDVVHLGAVRQVARDEV